MYPLPTIYQNVVFILDIGYYFIIFNGIALFDLRVEILVSTYFRSYNINALLLLKSGT